MGLLVHLTAVVLAASLSTSSVVNPPANTPRGAFELLILHNNDMHARFEQTSQLSGACTTADREAGKCYGGFPRVAYVVKEARKAAASGEGPPVLYLNAGDTYTGTAWFTIYKWKIAAEFINALQPDAVSLGNHEFDNGVSGLTPFIEHLTSPVLACNLLLTDVPELEAEKNLKNSVIININGTKVGVIGYLTPLTKVLAVANKVQYEDEVPAIKREVAVLQDEGVNIIIALGHSGFAKDIEIAREVDGVDLVIGGHTNTFLWNGTSPDSEAVQGPYPYYVKQSSGKQVPVVQAYAYTKYLGKLHMIFDSNGKIISLDGEPILLDKSIPQDPELLELVNSYHEKIDSIGNKVLGRTLVLLDGKCQSTECNLGNLITDSMVYNYAVNYKGDNWTDAPIAVIQGGGIRSSIAHADMPSDVTKADLLTVMPFQGHLVTVTMNGSILLNMLEHSVAGYSALEEKGEFLQVSGMIVEYNISKPAGSRVVKAEARCGECTVPNFDEIVATQMYTVIMPDFVSNGGDGYTMLKGLPVNNLPYDELTCTENYVQTHSPIYTAREGRITLVGELESDSSGSSNLLASTILTILSILKLTLMN